MQMQTVRVIGDVDLIQRITLNSSTHLILKTLVRTYNIATTYSKKGHTASMVTTKGRSIKNYSLAAEKDILTYI